MNESRFPVPSEAVEAGLLNSVNQNMSNWLEVVKFGQEDFSSHRDIYVFIEQYLSQYSKLPTSSQLNTRFEWHPPLGDFQYWLTEMKRYSLARRVLEAIQEGYNKISNPEEALSGLINNLSLIRSHSNRHIQATDYGASNRLELFDYRTEAIFNAKQILGLRTGMKVIDETMVGWVPGSLVGIYARPGVGKTWWLMWQGTNAWIDGGTVLAIGPEMPANMLNLRIDTMIAAAMGNTIDYGKLIIGDPSIRSNYVKTVEKMSSSQRWWTYDSLNEHSIGLGDIAALARQHTPSVILVDGIMLLRSTSRGATWEKMQDLAYGLKNLSTIYEVPIIVTHQASNSNRGRRTEPTMVGRGDDFIMPSLNDAADGDSFVRACSDVITMCAEPQSQYINWYSLRKNRERGWKQAIPSRMAFAWDVGTGRIIDLSHLGWAPDAVGQEVRRLLGV